jgi:hypothetical protein
VGGVIVAVSDRLFDFKPETRFFQKTGFLTYRFFYPQEAMLHAACATPSPHQQPIRYIRFNIRC